MKGVDGIDGIVQHAVSRVATELVGVSHWPDCSFVNLPLLYPDGSDVTVKIYRSPSGYRVTDNEFAFRAAVAHGLSSAAFVKLAARVTQDSLVARSKRALSLGADDETLQAAIVEVAQASWKIAHESLSPYDEVDDDLDVGSRDEVLVDRLVSLFGKQAVSVRPEVLGASTNHWRLTAMVKTSDTPTLFQDVNGTSYSIYRTSSAFSDIADLPRAPHLVAVVESKPALGARLNLLSRTGRVIEREQADDVYMRAAA